MSGSTEGKSVRCTGRGRQGRVTAFWRWFKRNEEGLRNAVRDRLRAVGAVQMVNARLERIDPHLAGEFDLGAKKVEFVISADGFCDAIPAVEALHAAAPQIDGWVFKKYRQRCALPSNSGGVPPSFAYRGIALRPDDVEVALEASGDKADLIIFVRGFSDKMDGAIGNKTEGFAVYSREPDALVEEKNAHTWAVALLLCDHILGEYDVMTKVGSIIIVPFDAPSDYQRHSLKNLPAVFDAFLSH